MHHDLLIETTTEIRLYKPASHPVSAGICPVSLELDEDNVIVQIY